MEQENKPKKSAVEWPKWFGFGLYVLVYLVIAGTVGVFLAVLWKLTLWILA